VWLASHGILNRPETWPSALLDAGERETLVS
jgi:hypothetical protein